MDRALAKRLEVRRAEYYARWEAVESAKARELAAMTDDQARAIIESLSAPEPWRENPNWSGLIEQQALFHKLPLP